MAAGGWPPPQGAVQTAYGMGGPAGRGPQYDLRPLSLGEVLDRTFAVYRAHFWLFVGIGSLSGAVQLLANMIQLLLYHGIRHGVRQGLSLAMLERQAGGLVTGLLFFLAAAVTQAATVWALSEVYLGRSASVGEAVRAVSGRWLRFVGIALWQGWSFTWLPLMILVPGALLLAPSAWQSRVVGGTLVFLAVTGGMVFGAISFLRNSLAVQAAVVEGLQVKTAMRRSKVLSAGTKGRIFVVLLITWCLFMVAGVLEMPLALVVRFGAGKGEQHVLAQAGLLLVNFVAHTMVTPVVLIGLSLVYFDQRVRQEALDLLLMLDGGRAAGPRVDGDGPLVPGGGELSAASDATAV